jgi:Raf kinase inhibitor-like YbhB/YbcL family protein
LKFAYPGELEPPFMKRILIMKKIFLTAVLLAVSCSIQAGQFELSSADIKPDSTIPERHAFNSFGCTGENLSPELNWSNPPAGTKSFAITVHDPDAPTGGAGFWHWMVIDIPAGKSSLARGEGFTDGAKLVAGARQIATDFGVPGWGGPCPPAGTKPHRYNFMIYALGVEKLELPPTATASFTGFMLNNHALGKAGFGANYGR